MLAIFLICYFWTYDPYKMVGNYVKMKHATRKQARGAHKKQLRAQTEIRRKRLSTFFFGLI
jgi:hypothetical protein